MKLFLIILIVAALGLSACNSAPEEHVMQDKATDGSTGKTTSNTNESVAEGSNKTTEQIASESAQAKITGIYWKLVTLNGKDIEDAANETEQPYFFLNTSENRVTGNGGCNVLFGNYILQDGNRIRFDQLGGTKRFCGESVVKEQEFMQVLGQADGYRINDDMLELYIGRGAPMAVFKAVAGRSK